MTTKKPKLPFTCEKQPGSGALGVVVTNAPLGSAAGMEMLAAGGNAIDAAVAAMLTLTVVEPMMVGIAGGGLSHIRLADGRHVVIDGLSVAGRNARPDMFTPITDAGEDYMETLGRRNRIGPSAVAVPGNLRAWHMMQREFGRLAFADVVEPAIRTAMRGFPVSHYLYGATVQQQADLAQDAELSRLLMPGSVPAPVGHVLKMPDYAESLRLIQKQGAEALHGGPLGQALVQRLTTDGADAGHVTLQDLIEYHALSRDAIFGDYRGYRVAGPPPPASSGVHVTQMLNMLEPFDLRAMGFGTPETLNLLAEIIRIAFEDRRAASGDPDFVDVPVARYTSKSYARECLTRLNGVPIPVAPGHESRDTTHLTVADAEGNIVSSTHTLNGLFGASIMVPGTGIIPNNYMLNYDPHPGRAMSVQPGKRVPTSMAPMIVLKGDRAAYALGLPGAVRIFPSAMQAIVNLIDFGMDLQQAVEAPRVWTEGLHIELEPALAPMADALRAMGHEVRVVPTIGGGMNAIEFAPDGMLTGAACWRADGTVMALSGGLARPGVRFKI